MSSDDDDFIAVALYDKSVNPPSVDKNSSDDDVPIFKPFCKPQLKTLGFASKLSAYVADKKLNEESLEPPKLIPPPKFSFAERIKITSKPKGLANPLKSLSENIIKPVKRAREDDDVSDITTGEPKISWINVEETDEPVDAPAKKIRTDSNVPTVTEEPKAFRLIENGNMRRLNMKGYRARGHGVGTGPAKGAKFKRKQWKQKIAYAKSNFGKECDDDDNFNYNLVGAELPTVAAEGEETKEDEIDPLSAEGIFSTLKKPSPVKKSPPKKASKSKVEKPKVEKPKPAPKTPKTPRAKKTPAAAKLDDSMDDEEAEVEMKKIEKPSRKSLKTPNKNSDDSDASMNLMLDSDSDVSPAKTVTRKKPAKFKTIIDSSDDNEDGTKEKKSGDEKSEESDFEPVITAKAKKAAPRKNKASIKLSDDDFIASEDDVVKPEKKKLVKTPKPKAPKTPKPKAVKTPRSKKSKEPEPEPEIEDDELLQFIETNGEQLEEPKPLFNLNEDGSLPEVPPFVYRILEKDFGHKSFRPHQAESIMRIACGISTVVVLSTGFGKSLIYQMAATLYAKRYPGSVVLVISPLISLMQDQVFNLSKSLKAAVCDSQLSEKDYQQLLVDLKDGKINILFMSPEAIMRKKIRNIPRLAFVCIDEIHCLSQWSHNFRPSYLQLSEILLTDYKVKCVLGLTATATQTTINEIKSYFNIDTSNIMLSCKLPNNLLVSCSEDKNKERALVNLLKSDEFRPYFHHVIVYCSRREITEKIAQLLRMSFETSKKLNLEELEAAGPFKKKKPRGPKIEDNSEILIAEAYHAGLSGGTRKRIQNQFIKGKLRVIVATMAFGMGIDMRNIRAVIHFNMPKSIENYVQEIGRAGRDNQLSRCHLFLETRLEDINDVKKHIHGDGYDHLIIKKLVIKIFDHCQKETCKYIDNPDVKNDHYSHHVSLPVANLVDLLDIKEETILTLMCYLQSANYIKLMSNVSTTCTLKSYKGPHIFEALSQENDFFKKVLKVKKSAHNYQESAEIVVDMMDLCNSLDGDYWLIRNQLKQLEWNINEYGQYKSKSGIAASFTDVSFYVKRRCIESDDELDQIYEMLWNRVCVQLNFCHTNFNALYRILNENSYKNVLQYLETFTSEQIGEDEDVDPEELLKPERHMTEKNNSLKAKLNEYFMNKMNLEEYSKVSKVDYVSNPPEYDKGSIDRLISNVNQFIYMYCNEMRLNGNIIARIFHGIGTPKYPAEVWGRQRNYWRAHFDVNFEKVLEIAREQLIKL